MLYLDSLIMHNFKSFKHANLRFDKGFNCIVGPNGSGKSNICDALLFVLGESSLRRMRVTASQQLINNAAKPKKEDGTKRAYVKLTLSGKEPIELMRVIKSNNKIGYRLNGKRASRQDLLEVLKANKSEISEINTVTQGEINTLLGLNARERRELIDVAAGIKEFNDKKASALKELEKVETKINEADIMLNERVGFMRELEKEKKDAEKYIELTNSIKNITYTVLKEREISLSSEYEKVIATIKSKEATKTEAENNVRSLDAQVEALSKEREKISKALNERSMEVSSTNKILEELNKNIAVKEANLNSTKEKVRELENNIAVMESEKSRLQSEIKANGDAIGALKTELEQKIKALGSKEDIVSSDENVMLGKFSANQARIDELEQELSYVSNSMLQTSFEIENLNKAKADANNAITKHSQEISSKEADNSASDAKLKDVLKKIESEKKSLNTALAEADQHKKRIDAVYADSVNIREQMAMSGSGPDKSGDVLKKGMQDGFFGRAYELCSYDDKYSTAVSAAAANRMNYFVVDSAETASAAIKILKSKSLGRASFIPLKDISVRDDVAQGLVPLIKFIKFEKRYEKAFSYIFSNTYLVDSIEAAKKQGFGRHRFVTLEGELVEQSGVITGGTLKAFQPMHVLESKFKKLEDERKALLSLIDESNADIDKARRSIAALQAEESAIGTALKYSAEAVESSKKEVSEIKKSISSYELKAGVLEKQISELKSKEKELSKSVSAIKAENEKISSNASSGEQGQKRKANKEEIAKIKALRDEAEQLKIKIATMSKEHELQQKRVSEIEAQIKQESAKSKALKKDISILDNEVIEEGKKRTEMREKISSHDAKSAAIYKQLQELEAKMSDVAMEKGKISSGQDRLNRDLIELESSKAQLNTRLGDIKAELLSYTSSTLINGKRLEELERELTIAKHDAEQLGAVNMKAPEIYELKKKDVDSAQQKLATLEHEKDSVLSMITEIESKKLSIFNETLKSVDENFKKLYSYIFDGSAYLHLDNPQEPFNSGLTIKITSAKNKDRASELLSGGEKSLLMLILIFAIQTRNPMSFYIFDEIDTSLDKENAKKLSNLLKELSSRSQIVVVSHNDSLISSAGTAIGVAHREGESQVVGVQLTAKESVPTLQQK
ncbi:MAG: chromosome segregation protein SMC [Candidatus Micrarchaeota archaeon]|nr:chromosome segregation protein SMC [Candidatus Micrarchaeota archaeon]